MRRAIAMLVLTSCVLVENEVPSSERNCGSKRALDDGMHCKCDVECKSYSHGGYCFEEAPDGAYPRGFCYGECKLDKDCADGRACASGTCYERCTTSDDCRSGRLCMLTDRDDVFVCKPFCDEDSDCESGSCNLYSGDCLEDGQRPKGGGLGAACTEKGECRSNYCSEGECVTICSPRLQHCPEGGYCTKEGRCVEANACSMDAGCGADASCADEDAGSMCEATDSGS
jgi:hypothetical protein